MRFEPSVTVYICNCNTRKDDTGGYEFKFTQGYIGKSFPPNQMKTKSTKPWYYYTYTLNMNY